MMLQLKELNTSQSDHMLLKFLWFSALGQLLSAEGNGRKPCATLAE